jgi:predicted RNase H-like nuclease (RuvC/YqgF family)
MSDSTQLNDSIEQTRSDVRRIRTQLERQEDQQEFHARRTKILSIVLLALVVLIAGAFWYAYPSVTGHQKAAADMLGLQNVASSLGEHVQSMEAKFNKAADDFPTLSTRMDELGASMKSGLQTARTQAQAAATQVGQRIRADLNQSIQAIQSRMAGVESNQREASERVNQLQEQVAGLKRELTSMREESSAATERIKQLQDEQVTRASAALSSLDQKMASHQTTLDSLSNRVDSKRVNFELEKSRTAEIVPGIFLTIRRADAKRQEVDGTVQVAADSRMFPIRAQLTQKPVTFYSQNESRPVELVFTQVAKNRISGYVVLPAAQTTIARADSSQ